MLLLVACAGPSNRDDSAPAGAPFVPDLPARGCGLDPYGWRTTAETGVVVDTDEVDDLAFSAEEVDSLLAMAGLSGLPPASNGVRMFRVRYLTQDRGELVEVTGLFAFPDLDVAADVPLLLWEHPTTGFTDACAPSAEPLLGGAYALLLASQGFAVAAPDYLGMAGWGAPSGRLHPWVVAEPTAIASLDAARALLAFSADGAAAFGLLARPDPARTLLWGASEGGFAALWSDRYAGAYAPELRIRGVVAAVFVTDPAALATRGITTWSDTTAGIAAALTTMADWYRSHAPLSEVLVPPFDTSLPEALVTGCGESPFEGASAVEEIFTEAMRSVAAGGDWGASTPWGCFLEDSVLRESDISRGSDAPVLLVTAEEDDLAWPAPVRDDVTALCAQGYRVEHVECGGVAHVSGAVDSLPYQLAWAQEAVAGGPMAGTTCAVAAPIDCAAAFGE